jgi:CRP-like cAMP-binding protein
MPLFIDEELAWLEEHGQILHRSAGHVFFEQGERTDFVLVIRKGHVKVTAGTPKRIVAIRRAGQMVGEMSPLRRKPRSASVEAIDEVEVLRVSASRWLEFLESHPRAARAQLVAKDERLDEATQKIAESELAVEQRLAMAFLELVDSGLGRDGHDGVALRVSQQDLASFAGASLDSVKKIIRTFKRSGIVDTARQLTTIRDLPALRQIADGERTASA